MAVEIDYFEYANDTDARLAYVTNATFGSDICSGGTATALSELENMEASKAFDDNASTFWSTSTTEMPTWIKYDFGSGVTKTVNRYTYTARATVYNYWAAWILQGSNDNTNWTDLDTQSGQSFTGGQKKTYTLSVLNITAYRYYRFWITSTQSEAGAEAAEIELMEIPLQCGSESTIKTQGSYSLKAVAAQTDSLNKTLTKTF